MLWTERRSPAIAVKTIASLGKTQFATRAYITSGDSAAQSLRPLVRRDAMSDARGITEVGGIKEYRYFAGGEWRAAKDNKTFNVYRPYDRALYARVAAGGRPEAKLAVDAAAKAFPAWSQTTPAERAKLFFKAAEIVKRRRAEIAGILAIETGSTISHGLRGLRVADASVMPSIISGPTNAPAFMIGGRAAELIKAAK
jgi:hypothetical protein